MRRLPNIADSPLTLALLGAATFLVGILWYSARQADAAPILPNWDWSKHPEALLIYYKPPSQGCACSDDVKALATQASERGLKVVLVSASPANSADLDGVPADARLQGLPYRGPHEERTQNSTVLLRIRNARVVQRVIGTKPPADFFGQ